MAPKWPPKWSPQMPPLKCCPSNAAPENSPQMAPENSPKSDSQRLPKFHSKSSTFQKCNIPKNIPKPPQSKIVTIQRTMIQNCNDPRLQNVTFKIYHIPNSKLQQKA